ncbi:MAG: ATP-binding cassette domain-containing protein [Acidobacteriia bacterium]|nr:ATP-binding cassette domain-containing protein [Terriglobia bacterium]
MQTSDSRTLPGDPRAAFVQFEHVYKSFGEKKVLFDVSFDLRPGETLAILGRSGVGKSVTLMHLVGFLRPDKGRIFVKGQDVATMSEEQLTHLRQRISLVFQSGALFDSLSVAENVTYAISEKHSLGDEEAREEAIKYLQMVDLEELVDLYPQDLSTGHKRGVAIARALAAQPEAILYDEPTTMVDPIQSQLVAKLIRRLHDQYQLTSVVVTHDLKLTQRVAERVVLLEEGRVHFFGTRDDFFNSSDTLIREFVKSDQVRALQQAAH